MITINKDRTAYIPENDRHIGFENDNLVETRYFDIADDDVSDFHFKLDIADTLDIIDLEKETLEDGRCVLVWKITSTVIGEGGIIRAQLRAFDENGERVWHSHIMDFLADSSVNGEKLIDDERTLSEFEQLEARVTSAVGAAESFSNTAYSYAVIAENHKDNAMFSGKQAEASAESAKEFCNTAEEYASDVKDAESRIASEIAGFEESYGNASVQAQKANKHYTDKNNPHGVTAKQIGAAEDSHIHENYDRHTANTENPHRVTASQTGAYTKEEVDGLISPIMDTEDFVWTDFEYFADGGNGFIGRTTENTVVIDGAEGNEFLQMVCRDNILGFTFSISGYSDARLRINGEYRIYKNELRNGEVFATDTIPLTFLTKDLFFYGDGNTWSFSDMKKGKMPLLDLKLGDIDKALDGIIAIQEQLIGE